MFEQLCRPQFGHFVMSGANKLSLYEEVLRQVRYVNSEPQELNSRTFVLSCTELNGRFVSNKLETTVCDSLSCLARLCNHFCCAMRMHSADYAMARCPSVCLSHAGIVCKWLYISSEFFHRRVAPPF